MRSLMISQLGKQRARLHSNGICSVPVSGIGVQTYVDQHRLLHYRWLTYDSMNLSEFTTVVVAEWVKIEY